MQLIKGYNMDCGTKSTKDGIHSACDGVYDKALKSVEEHLKRKNPESLDRQSSSEKKMKKGKD